MFLTITHSAQRPHDGRSLITVFGGALLLASLSASPATAAAPTATPGPHSVCPKPGQKPMKRGLIGSMICVTPYRDAGKACSSKSDCAGRCVAARMPKGVPPVVGAKVKGVCEAESPSFGCLAEVEKGRLKTPMLCTS